MKRLHVATLCSLSLVLALEQSADAEPSTSDRALAEALFRDAKQLVDASQWPAACAKFAESQRLDPKLGTLLYMATCHEKEGKLATAWIEFNEARSLAVRANQADREKLAKERALALEPRLAHVVVNAEAPAPGLGVTLDGKLLQSAAFGSPLPLDPGQHSIVATAPDREPYEEQLTVTKEGEDFRVTVPLLKEKATAPAVAVAGPPQEDEEKRDDGSRRVVGWVIGGIGLVALVGGAYFGVRALSTKSDADKECDASGACSQRGLDQSEQATMFSHISTAGLAFGAVGVGVGTYLVLTAAPSKSGGGAPPEKPASSWRVAPSVAPGAGGFIATGHF